ncbi:MAG: cation diffusion facilitator family transporter [Candidatus Bathyarchaeia archaeon]
MAGFSQGAVERGLVGSMLITGGLMLLEAVGGLLTGSLALLSDAWHMLSDFLSLVLCFTAGRMARRDADVGKTFGYGRVEVLSALANGFALLIIAAFIFYEAFERFVSPIEVRTVEMLIIAAVGLVGNLVSMGFISGGVGSLNVKAAFLHVMGDALSSIGVIAAGLVMHFTGFYFADPAMSIVIGSIITFSSLRMLREVVHVLLEGTPRHIDLEEVTRALEGVEGVAEVHDLHVWSTASWMHFLTAHIVVKKEHLADAEVVMNNVKEMLALRFRLAHTTLQIEAEGYKEIGQVHRLKNHKRG